MADITINDPDGDLLESLDSRDGTTVGDLLAMRGAGVLRKDGVLKAKPSLVLSPGTYTLGPTVQPSPPPPQQQEEARLEHLLQTAEFDATSLKCYNEFQFDGFGPFVVQRETLLHQVIQEASPLRSVHISGCKGAGKTILLKLIGMELTKSLQEKVYYFTAVTGLNHYDWTAAVTKLIREKRKAYFLVDETQSASTCIPDALVRLLKNDSNHQLTVIGAGVPEFRTLSASFVVKHTTEELFLTEEALRQEGIVNYFDGTPKAFNILAHIRNHCGGHIYPLMRGMELLKGLITYATMTSDDVIAYYQSPEFRRSKGYNDICTRVLPPVLPEEIHPLFYSTNQIGELHSLQKKGFVSDTGKVLSRLLLDAYIMSIAPNDSVTITGLFGGLDGIQQVLQHSLPGLEWSQYARFGGPVEDALSFELLTLIARISQVTTRLFNPKLVDVGTSGRRPDIYINSQVNGFVECVLTTGHSEADKKNLDEHIDRFCEQESESQVRYRLLDNQDYAVLNFQQSGSLPLNPSDEFSVLFEERVFTFLMATRKIYKGNTPMDA